jgi:signal transduction histidine kinase
MSAPITDQDRIAALEAKLAKAERIIDVLMNRVERSTDLQGNAFSLFETAITLEAKVRDRTADLERALTELAASNAELGAAKTQADEAERRLVDAIASINEGFALFDAEDRLVLYNYTYLRLWPRFADRIQPGVTFDAMLRWIRETGSTKGVMEAPQRWISERAAQHRMAEGGHVHILADGRYIQINELRTSDGGIVGVYTDITDVKAEDARQRNRDLAEKTAILQATLDTIRLGVAVYGPDRRLTASNGPLTATLGLPPDGLTRVETFAGMMEHGARWTSEEGDVLGWLPRGAADVVAQHRRPDGRLVEVRRSRMADGGMVMSFEDITERLAADAALRDANDTLERRVRERTGDLVALNAELRREVAERLSAEAALREAKTAAEDANLSKTRFLAAASHDLLQPLNAARLFVSAAADRRLAPATRTLVRQTASALDSVEDLLEALLEISKLDAGAIVPQPTDVPLADLLRAMHAEFAPVARARGLALDIAPSDLWVRTDSRLARRILQNLISNALRYTEAGRVDIRCTPIGDGVRIDVRDTGEGIAPEHQQCIFEEFRRLREGGRDRGMGLGLAIVERAARMLDTSVELQSTLGTGSTFSITLPLAAASEPAPAPWVDMRPRRAADRAVLVIDNEAVILEGMSAMLTGWGYRVAIARSTAEALAVIASGFAPDIVVADYHLDGAETGSGALQRLRERSGIALPAVIVTADRTPELRAHLTADGFACLTKPLKPAHLRALLSAPTR